MIVEEEEQININVPVTTEHMETEVNDLKKYKAFTRESTTGKVYYESGKWPEFEKLNHQNNFRQNKIQHHGREFRSEKNYDGNIVTEASRIKEPNEALENTIGSLYCHTTPIDDLIKLRESIKDYKKQLEGTLSINHMTKVDLSEEKESLIELTTLLQEVEATLKTKGFEDVNGKWLYTQENVQKVTKQYQAQNLVEYKKNVKVISETKTDTSDKVTIFS